MHIFRCFYGLAILAASACSAQANNTNLILEKAEQFAARQAAGLGGQVVVKASALDPRLQLSPCQDLEAFSPPGTRPVGSTTVGIRCLSPNPWSILVPVKVSVLATYVAAARQLSPGLALQAADLVVLQGDLGTLPSGTVANLPDAVGKTLKFGLASGQALRRDLLLAPAMIQQGQDVKLVIIGKGFTISADGKALNNAAEGQTVQVKTPSGSMVSGIAKGPGLVETRH